MEEMRCPALARVLRVRVTDDLVLDGGTWELAESEDGQPVARITPPATPMFLQVVEYLETQPVPQGGNLRRDGESRAAVAVCLRWGSYFALLADPTRPAAPDIDDERTSQIADDEMARMNIEISAGIAWWLTLCGSDERRYWDLGPPRTGLSSDRRRRPSVRSKAVAGCQGVRRQRWWPRSVVRGLPDDLDQALVLAERCGIRAIANTITLYAWRNGPVEYVHAGWADGYELGARRVLPAAEKAIIRQAQSGLYTGLKVVDILKFAAGWPPPAERVLPFLHPVIAPSRWSYTEQSRAVELPLRRGVQDS